MNPFNRNAALWIVIVLLLALLYSVFQGGTTRTAGNAISYSDFVRAVEQRQVQDVRIQGNTITGTFREPRNGLQKFATYAPSTPPDEQLMPMLIKNVDRVDAGPAEEGVNLGSIFVSWLPVLVLVGVYIFFLRQMQSGTGRAMGFGKSRARLLTEKHGRVTFEDVAGIDEAKSELEEIVDFLKDPQKFQRLGGKIPKGVLLVGPPGTGKTLLARAVAGEAGVPFFSMSGSEFVEVLVGVGASRVRDLFDQAKKASPSIIFIDEIDAVGRQRGTSLTTNDEREQTLNQLLVEMDGFDTRQAVVVIAATNRPDGLDQALLRPGRFDRRVTVDRPDWKGRQAILMIHTRGVPLAPDVDLQQLARATTGMVGADLANLVNEAALLAARNNQDRVTMASFDKALDRIQIGAERPLVLSEEDLRVVAVHEGGHALVGLLTPHSDPVTKVTIVPRGQALGVTQYTPLDDRYNYSRDYLFGLLMTALGGRGAEEVMLGSITTGAENDLQKVTLIARNMVARYGMSDRLGLISFSDRTSPFGSGGDFGQREYSDATAAVIDEETRDLVQTAYQRVKQLLTEHKPTLERIATELRRHETLDARQLSQILIETGVSLAEVAPTPNAETVGLQPLPDDAPAPQSPLLPNNANGMNGVNSPQTPYPGGFGQMQN